MPDPKPMNVYPDPNGGSSSSAYAPSNIPLAIGSIASGAAAVVTAAAGSGTAPDQMLLFFQEMGHRGTGGFLGLHAASGTYVSLFLLFSSLSVVLATINLVIGLRMKEQLIKLSSKVESLCDANGVFPWWVAEKKKTL